MPFEFVLRSLIRSILIILLAGDVTFAATPPEGTGENVSLVKESTNSQVLIASELKSLVKTIDGLRDVCRFKDTSHLVDSRNYEEKLITCSRGYRNFNSQVDSLMILVIKERISLQSGKFGHFPTFIDRSLNLLSHIDADLSLVEKKLNQIADLFIEEYGKALDQKVQSALAQAKLKGTYKVICTSFNFLAKIDKERIPLSLSRAKDYGDVFLIQDRIWGMLQLAKAFNGKCNDSLDLNIYQALSESAEKSLQKFDSSKWVREQCQRLSKGRIKIADCPREFKINSYLVNYLKSGGPVEK